LIVYELLSLCESYPSIRGYVSVAETVGSVHTNTIQLYFYEIRSVIIIYSTQITVTFNIRFVVCCYAVALLLQFTKIDI